MKIEENFKIRNAEVSDYIPVLDAMLAWWDGRDLRDKVYRGLFLHFKQTSFIIEDEKGSLVAFLLGYLSQTFQNEGYINWIGVHPDHRNKGIARMLYERFFDVARSAGRNRVTCGTSIINKASKNWHKHMGFSVEIKETEYLFSIEI